MASAAAPAAAFISGVAQQPAAVLGQTNQHHSYLAGSSARNTFAAEALETSVLCRTPPKQQSNAILGSCFDIIVPPDCPSSSTVALE